MTNSNAFIKATERSGMTLRGIAKSIGISYTSLLLKLRNVTEFHASEIEMFCRVANVRQKSEVDRIFFLE